MREPLPGQCEHCGKQFNYYLIHSGFNDSFYAYCAVCGMTAELSIYDQRMPKNYGGCPPFQEICEKLEPYIQPCACGGTFKKGAAPRCPYCLKPLSAETAAIYIERNALGTSKGWRWQRNWHDTYCMVVENRLVTDIFKV
jgi:hypothetical protein